VCALLLAAPAAASASASGFPHFGAGCARDDLTFGQSRVKAELCRSTSTGGRAVVILHGCGGFSTFDHRLATDLPSYGISTLDVDLFGLTPPPGTKGFCDAHGRAGDVFGKWIEVAQGGAAKLRATAGIDPRGVGVVGWSLGGGVALAAAAGSPGERPFDAVAGFSTGSFVDPAFVSSLPPTILLSGGTTDAIPLADTLPLYDTLRADHIPAQLYVYAHGSHGWPGKQGTLGIRHAADFLHRYLR
jgi:dienelactone hydrolase